MNDRKHQTSSSTALRGIRGMILAAGIFALAGVIFCTSTGLLGGFLLGREAARPRAPTPERVTAVVETAVPLATPTPSPTPEPSPPVALPTVTATPTLPPFEPVAPGEEDWANGMTMRVEGLTRPADAIVERSSSFNPPPDPGHEYVLVELAITCERSEGETCLYSPLINFDLLGDAARYTPQIFLMDVPGLLEGGEIAAGGSVSGAMAFVIDQDETDLVLMYQNLMGTERAFLAVEAP